jgi:hypothetical protein
MFHAYLTLGRACQANVPGLRWIDLDKSQLDDPEAFNSLIVPALLIGQSDLHWTQLAGRNRLGEGLVIAKTVVLLPTQTHLSHPFVEQHLTALDVVAQVERAILDTPGVLACTDTKEYSLLTYYVVESMFQVSFRVGPSYAEQPVAVLANAFLFNPSTQLTT